MNTVVPLLSSIVALVFALAVLDQFLARRKPYQLVWAVGLLMYTVSTACEFVVGAYGVSAAVYRLWYLFGAVLVAAYLGMGTVYLLARRRVAHVVLVLLLLLSAFAIYRVVSSELALGNLVPGENLTGEAFPSGAAGPRILTPIFNSFGTIALVGGALWSAWVFWRRRILPHRVVSNVLIAVGALLPVLGGSLARAGSPELLYMSELLGVVIIFLGFLRSREVFGLYRIPLIHGFRRVPE